MKIINIKRMNYISIQKWPGNFRERRSLRPPSLFAVTRTPPTAESCCCAPSRTFSMELCADCNLHSTGHSICTVSQMTVQFLNPVMCITDSGSPYFERAMRICSFFQAFFRSTKNGVQQTKNSLGVVSLLPPAAPAAPSPPPPSRVCAKQKNRSVDLKLKPTQIRIDSISITDLKKPSNLTQKTNRIQRF